MLRSQIDVTSKALAKEREKAQLLNDENERLKKENKKL